jgi:hypothetical protein
VTGVVRQADRLEKNRDYLGGQIFEIFFFALIFEHAWFGVKE